MMHSVTHCPTDQFTVNGTSVMRTTKDCDHGNTMGLHGQVVCVSCNTVVRRMTPEERAVDWTFRAVVDPKAMAQVKKLLRDAGADRAP